MRRICTSRIFRVLTVIALSTSGLIAVNSPASNAITLPPKGVSQELWTAFQEVAISNIESADRNLRWTNGPSFYIAGDPTAEDNSTFRDTIAEISKYCNNIRPSISTLEPLEGARLHYVAPGKFKSIIPETPTDVTSSYGWSTYYLNRGLTKFTAVFSTEMTQTERNRSTQIRILQGMGLRSSTTNLNARIFSWAYPYESSKIASELDKQIIRLYCSTYTRSWDTAQQTFDAITTAWAKKVNFPDLSLNIKVGEYKNQLNFVFNFDPSAALDNQLSGIEYRILDTSGNVVKSDKIEVASNLFKTYTVILSGIKDSSRYKMEAYPINSSGTGSLSKGEGRAGTQPAPVDTLETAIDASAEIIDARKQANDAKNASKEALAMFGKTKVECIEVSTQFETKVQELYDTTNLSTYCEQLDQLVTSLNAKIESLDPDKATNMDQVNDLTDKGNAYAEEADALVASLQDITDELLSTQKYFKSSVMVIEQIRVAETEIIDGWKTFTERIALLPKSTQATIKKTSSYKSALAEYMQVIKSIGVRDEVLEDFSSLADPNKLSELVSKLSSINIYPQKISAFKKSLISLNKGIPSIVCVKGLLTLLPSKSGKCLTGYERTPTQ